MLFIKLYLKSTALKTNPQVDQNWVSIAVTTLYFSRCGFTSQSSSRLLQLCTSKTTDSVNTKMYSIVKLHTYIYIYIHVCVN